jgi:beta-hydroxylase
VHYAENRTQLNRIVLFCDVERPLRFAPVAALNRWFSRHVMSAATAPNQEGDRLGGINRAFGVIQVVRLWGKRVKDRSRFGYYALQWLLFGGPLAWWLLS